MSGTRALAGRRILVVDDEPLVALLTEDLLLDAGAEVIGPAASVAEALALVATDAPEGALLDVNLGGELVYPVAEALARRGTPFAFVTGYSQLGVDAAFDGVVVFPKPLPLGDFAVRVARAFGWDSPQAACGG